MAMFGKILVLITLALSLLCLVVGLGIFTNSINWGWKTEHQRQQFGTKIASEFDKRKEILAKLDEQKPKFVAGSTQARAKLMKTEANIARDQLRYVDELDRIQSGTPQPLANLRKLHPWLFDKKNKTGKPLLQDEFTKSYQGYFTEIGNLTKQINEVRDKIGNMIDKEKEVTEQLIGPPAEKGKRGKGLYALINVEQEVQQRAREELEDLKEILVQELVDSQLYLQRQDSLRLRLRQLERLEVSKGQR
jgi:hypothetical protein